MKRNYKSQMYRQPSKGGPAAEEETLQDPIALPGAICNPSSYPHIHFLLPTLAAPSQNHFKGAQELAYPHPWNSESLLAQVPTL
jgi:hypothetical protein